MTFDRHGSSQLLLMETQQEGGEYTGSYEDSIWAFVNGSIGQVDQALAA